MGEGKRVTFPEWLAWHKSHCLRSHHAVKCLRDCWLDAQEQQEKYQTAIAASGPQGEVG